MDSFRGCRFNPHEELHCFFLRVCVCVYPVYQFSDKPRCHLLLVRHIQYIHIYSTTGKHHLPWCNPDFSPSLSAKSPWDSHPISFRQVLLPSPAREKCRSPGFGSPVVGGFSTCLKPEPKNRRIGGLRQETHI
jgi:hypothetical protein